MDRFRRVCRLLPGTVLPSPSLGRVGVHDFAFEACSGFTRVTARRFARAPKAPFIAGLRPGQSPVQAACQLPGQPTIARVGLSPTRSSRLRRAHPSRTQRMARPVCKGFVEIAADQSASTYPASKNSPFRPRWRYARSGPHKLSGLEGHRICQASGAPFDCQAISSSPLANIFWRSDALYVQTPEFYAAMVGCAANLCCRRSTAQAILASLLAKATTATLRWARPNSAFAHRPSGVSRSAT